jgi:hypothetical protein
MGIKMSRRRGHPKRSAFLLPVFVLWAVLAGLLTFAGAPHECQMGPLSASYMIEDRKVSLLDGRYEVEAAPGSATKVRTWVFGDPVSGDLDDDGDDDAALLLVHAPGGSGTFYYVAAALNMNGAYQGTNTVLLGDRIAPQNISIRNGVIIADYADRHFGESMTTPPSVGKTTYPDHQGWTIGRHKASWGGRAGSGGLGYHRSRGAIICTMFGGERSLAPGQFAGAEGDHRSPSQGAARPEPVRSSFHGSCRPIR